MNPYELITRNTQEIIQPDELKHLLKEKKQPCAYLGTAITGRPHVGYFVWALKLADFLKAGLKVKLLLADVHGALDGTPWEILDKRYAYYSQVIPLMFEAIGQDITNLEIIKGSEFQLSRDYMFDMYKLSTLVSIHDATKAASEVVKLGDNPKLSGIIYPLMQALDEEYLGADIQYGGIDQRKILVFAREYLPKMGYKSRVEIMTPLIPGLIGKKMSASDPKSKIDLLDDEKDVHEKIKSAYTEPGVIDDNGLLAFLKHVLMVFKTDRGDSFTIERPEKFGGNASYSTYEQIEADYAAKKIHPLDLKQSLFKEINTLLTPFRQNRQRLLALSEEAYSNI